MTEAYIYDHVRSPRGRGKQGGSLNPITPINLTTQVLQALRDRNSLDTSILDDVILGCVAPVGEQGANIARVAAMSARLRGIGPRQADQSLLCAQHWKPSTRRLPRSWPDRPRRP